MSVMCKETSLIAQECAKAHDTTLLFHFSFFVGVVFTSLPTPPEDPSLAENYVNELEIFTGKQL